MNKILIFAVLFVALAVSVSAETCAGNVKVHTVDQDGKDLSGVLVAPEWKFASVTGWNDYFPKEKTTDANGLASDCLWLAVDDETLQVNYATIDGYTCTQKEDTRITADKGMNTLEVVCTADNEVPEFGVIAGALALIGAVAVFAFKRK
jgi:hypothetical protein